MASNKYIVRRPIKDAQSCVVGYEILYHGEDQLYGSIDSGAKKTNEFAAADTIYRRKCRGSSVTTAPPPTNRVSMVHMALRITGRTDPGSMAPTGTAVRPIPMGT